jgi:hypothetical protein
MPKLLMRKLTKFGLEKHKVKSPFERPREYEGVDWINVRGNKLYIRFKLFFFIFLGLQQCSCFDLLYGWGFINPHQDKA